MNLAQKLLVFSLLLAAIAGGGYYYYTGYYLPAQVTPEPALQTAKVRSGDIVISISGAGNLLPADQVSFGFRNAGVLIEVNVQVGSQVEAGQLLARLEDSALRLQLRQSQLNLQALISPEAIIEAEVSALNAQTKLETAIDELEYLISPAVWRWENELERAQEVLDTLKAESGTTAEELIAAQSAVDTARQSLEQAQYLYDREYVPATFTFTYTDLVSGEEIESIIPPAELDITLARAKVKSAEWAVQDANAYAEQLKLGQPCGEESAVSAAEGTLLSKLEQACLAIEEIELALENTQLLAPIAGTITSLNASVGQAVGTSPIMTIATLEQLQLRIYIEETDLALLKVGQEVRVILDAYPDHTVIGQISSLEPALQTVDGTTVAVAWAVLDKQSDITLLSGMAAEVEVIAGESTGTLLVPVQALRELAPGSYAVFVVQPDGQLKLFPVTVGLKDFANAEILSGLEIGDVISTGTVETK